MDGEVSKRKSISVKGETYFRLRGYAQKKGRSMSGLLEEMILDKLDAVEDRGKDDVDTDIDSQHKMF